MSSYFPGGVLLTWYLKFTKDGVSRIFLFWGDRGVESGTGETLVFPPTDGAYTTVCTGMEGTSGVRRPTRVS